MVSEVVCETDLLEACGCGSGDESSWRISNFPFGFP
jgi:hypothetical protein